MEKAVLVVFLFLSLFACNEKEDEKDTFSFNIPEEINKNNTSQFDISIFYNKIGGFELDREGGEIGYINKLDIHRNILFVLDARFAKRLFAYDLANNGKFLFAIGENGKGPGEFLKMYDFAIDSANSLLLVSDIQQRKVVYFDLTGKYIKDHKLNFTPLKLFCNKEYVYFISNAFKGNDMGIKITDKKLRLLKEYLPFKDFPYLTNGESGFSKVGNKLLLSYPNCNTIFQISQLLVTPYLTIDTGNRSFYKYVSNNGLKSKQEIFDFSRKDPDYKDIVLPNGYFENGEFRMFNFIINNRMRHLINPKTEKDHKTSLAFLVDDIAGIPINYKTFDNVYGAVSVLNPRSLATIDLDQLKKNKRNISDQLIEEIKLADIDSNPFIIFYK